MRQTAPGINRRSFLRQGALATAALGAMAASGQQASGAEWRNKQAGMAYRRLGRTDMMISEILCGGDPVRPKNYKHVELAIDMGLNYLDMAAAYGNGDAERAFGQVIKPSSMRERVFMNTKISPFNDLRNKLYNDIFKGLPSEKQKAIVQRAEEMRRERRIDKPGYFVQYFSGQEKKLAASYLSNAMAPDYRHRVEGSAAFRQTMIETLEGSLQRAGTDYFDIVMCPHGAASPEELQYPEIYETFLEIKKQGKARFLGVSAHNDPAGILRAATEIGHYDVVMMAYNIINGGYMEDAIHAAKAKDVGVIAMKVANPVARQHRKGMEPIPQWRVDKLHRIVPGEYSTPQKAYIWALQNPDISAVISDLWDENYVKENLAAAGKKVELQPA